MYTTMLQLLLCVVFKLSFTDNLCDVIEEKVEIRNLIWIKVLDLKSGAPSLL